MKTAVVFTLVILISSCVHRSEVPDTRSLVEKTSSLMGSLAKKEFYQAGKDFSDTFKASLSPLGLERAWRKATKEAGAFRKLSNVREGKSLQYDVVYVKCEFEKEDVDVQVAFDAEKKVVGLYFFPAPRS
jgi:Protein of unknown function (DUF3887)